MFFPLKVVDQRKTLLMASQFFSLVLPSPSFLSLMLLLSLEKQRFHGVTDASGLSAAIGNTSSCVRILDGVREPEMVAGTSTASPQRKSLTDVTLLPPEGILLMDSGT